MTITIAQVADIVVILHTCAGMTGIPPDEVIFSGGFSCGVAGLYYRSLQYAANLQDISLRCCTRMQ